MATIALPYTSGPTEFPIQMGSWLAAEPQGVADRQLRDNAQSTIAHWRNRAEHLLGTERAEESYVSVPFEPIRKIRVRYKHVGVLKSIPYPLDE